MAMKAFENGEEFIPRLVFPSTAGAPLNGINVYHRDFFHASKRQDCAGLHFTRTPVIDT